MVVAGQLQLCFDARILLEYAEVLARPKFRFDQDKVATLLDYIRCYGQAIAASPLSQHLPDFDDEPFLEVALSAQATSLVTGNQIHFPDNCCQGMLVLSPAEFLHFYRTLSSHKKL